ncbi:MAG: Alkaline shock protein 23 [Lentisphaerae bacterium ADurb.Bin242]|nr:MAG: Alkaline shock protein 23 [Lentisphaerae bacterium ADurb.Bin242]
MNKSENEKTSRSVFPDGTFVPSAVSGIVKVHESVVAAIIRKATCSVPGVVRLAGNMLMDNIAEFVGSKKVYDRAISITMGDNSVEVEVKVILSYGVYIPDVAKNIQETVIDEIGKITGMQVPRIDVIVIDLEAEKEETTETEEEDEDPQK